MAVIGKSMIQTEGCINRCDGLIYKDQQNCSRKTGNINKRKPTETLTGIKILKLEREKPRRNTSK